MPPPDARIRLGRGRPAASMRSRPSRRPNATPSMTARVRWRRSCPMVSPTNAPRAYGSGYGLRSPVRYGRKNRPSVAASTSAADSTREPNSVPGASASRNQRRLPAAESITDIMCHRPGTAWQKAWTMPLRLVERPVRRGEDDAGGPEGQRHLPGRDDPDADRVGRLVAAAGDDRGAGTQPGGGGGERRDRAGHLRPLERRRQPGGRDPERGDDLGRPVARGQVEQDRAGPVGLVHGVLAGQAEPQVVLGQQDVGGPRPHVGLVIADPDELRRGEAGQRVVAGDRDEPLRADCGTDRVALGGGPLVVPQDGRAEHAVGVVEQHQPVHLAGQPDRLDVVAGDARGGQDGPDRGHGPVPPGGRVLLAPERVGRAEAVLGGADPADRAGLVDEDGLGRRRRDVDAEGEAHPQWPAVDSTGAPAALQVDSLTTFSSSSWWPDTGWGSIAPDATFSSSDASVSEPSRMALPSAPPQPR